MQGQGGQSTAELMSEIAHLRLLPEVANNIGLGRVRASGSFGTVYDLTYSSLQENRKVRR